MAEDCHGCMQNIIGLEKIIKCFVCNAVYHKKCTNANSDTITWVCEDCNNIADQKAEDPSDKILKEIRINNEKLSAMKTDLDLRLDELKKTVEGVKESQEFISKQYEDLNTKFTEILDKFNDLNKNVSANEVKCKELEKSVATLNDQINKLEQKQLSNCAIINGIDKSNNENLLIIVEKICDFLNAEIDTAHILNAYRTGASGTVVVEFSHRVHRDKFLSSRKSQKLFNKNIGNKSNTQIFINEKLTSGNIEIFKEACKLRKVGFRYVWVKHGAIYAKKSEKHQTRKLSTLQEAEKFYKIAFKEYSSTPRSSVSPSSSNSYNSKKQKNTSPSP